ncbi:hypothetical protein [Streptomyces antimicrobicus]|uniref:Uncharacterized protein n=1 Tax=Streptomyces antimicrobicus TaxID=2883108 RepID=A0ABS8B4S0_9ACTN|nr:hypothetical protein [Streptomyces antimicrobicus]MCB5179581.1 hypothetical protein [Streptomyces antimicrobicus]
MIEQEQDSVLEARLRRMLAEDAEAVRPGQAPVTDIVRRGRQERCRQLAATAAALVVLGGLAGIPAVALTLASGGQDEDSPARYVAMASGSPATTSSAPVHVPSPPASPELLADGVTYDQAASWVDSCLRFKEEHRTPGEEWHPVRLSDMRIVLSQRAAADEEAPGGGHWVVAAKDDYPQTAVLCRVSDGRVTAFIGGQGGQRDENSPLVARDPHASKLWQQPASATAGSSRPAYRWGDFGTVAPEVSQVTVSYGGTMVQAGVQGGRYAVTGISERSDPAPPRLRGYDAKGVLIYDSAPDGGPQQDSS